VFEPFFTTKEVGKGSGLGLSMVQGFAMQSGGTIRIASRLGEGTTVEVWLPRAPAAPAGTEEAASVAPPIQQSAGRILLCDDDPDVRRFISEFLRASGYVIREANNPSAALNILESPAELDLLITDFAMAEMNGAALIREARRRRPDIKSIMITGHPQATSDPLDGVPLVAKPFKPAALAECIAEILAAEQPVSRQLGARQSG
jgi:CheY-like chemotaxis protein